MAANSGEKVYFAPNSQIYIAPAQVAALPTDLTTELDASFRSLGYVNEDGIGVTPTREWEPVTAAQSASPVKYVLSSAALTLTFTMLQFDEDTVELYFGTSWTVQGDVRRLDLASSPALAEHAMVIEFGDWTEEDDGNGGVTITGAKNRLVIPRGMVSSVNEFKINRTETSALGVTFDAMDRAGSLGYLLTNVS